MTSTKAVVLAQAHSTVPVANRALLRHALDWLAQGGVRDVAVIVPQELAGRAREAVAGGHVALRVDWVEQLPDESVAHVLGDLTGFLEGEAFVLHLADSLARQSLRSLTAGGAGCDTEALLVTHESRGAELAQVVQLRAAAGGGRSRPRPLRNDSAGVAVLSAGAVDAAAGLDVGVEHVLDALAERIEEQGGRVGTCRVADWWRYRAGTEALLEGNRMALEGVRADYDHARVASSRIQGGVVVHPDASVTSSVVRGPAIIGARARVRDAYVGPYTSIGEDVVVEGAEIEHSVILPGASIRHVGGRLEASVIGQKSRIFRDFRLPRALRLTVGDGAEVCLT